jgi:isocitrate lyase
MPSTLSTLTQNLKAAITMTHTDIDAEEQQYLQDVEAVKQWWTDSRWRHTKRPFTAEQIVQKRGTIKIDYPSNAMSKKVWKTLEGRFAVSTAQVRMGLILTNNRTRKCRQRMAVSNLPC